MERLFDENDRYSPEAEVLAEVALKRGIEAAVNAAAERGYSLRDMAALLHGAVEDAVYAALARKQP